MKKATLGSGKNHAKGYSMFPKQVVNHDNTGPVDVTVVTLPPIYQTLSEAPMARRFSRTLTVTEKIGSGRINTRLRDGFALLGGE